MIPVPQRIVGCLQDEQRGDCYKCCVASILELPYEEVPHFAQGEPNPESDHYSNVFRWLHDCGFPLKMRSISYLADSFCPKEDFHAQFDYQPQPRNRNPGYWIATVKSRVYPESHHAIVMHGNDVAFDPSPTASDPRPYEFCGEDVFVPDLPAIVRSITAPGAAHAAPPEQHWPSVGPIPATIP